MSVAKFPSILVYGDDPARRERVCDMLSARGMTVAPWENGKSRPRSAHLALVIPGTEKQAGPNGCPAELASLEELVRELKCAKLTTVVWGRDLLSCSNRGDEPGIELLADDISIEEVVGRLTTLARYVPLVRCMDEELKHLQRLGHQLNRYIADFDRDMQLAGRLQRDFMPRTPPRFPGVAFSYLFRPATFVSGDIFDIIPIDQTHVGVFIADAMGHGTAAGLITMFLRKALIPRTGAGDEMQILPPADAMQAMHEGLARHELPNANFVTAAYALLDRTTCRVRFARGGHPYPLHFPAGGGIRELTSDGGLIGLADLPPEISESSVELAVGDRIVFYTDGLESLFLEPREELSAEQRFTPLLQEWAELSIGDFTQAVGDYLDRSSGSLNPEDDITIVGFEVTDLPPEIS